MPSEWLVYFTSGKMLKTNFQAFGSAIERYQNAESVQFYKRERSVEKAQVRISYTLNERLKIL